MHRTHARAAVVAAALPLAAATPPLLTRMRREFEVAGELSAATIAGMYAARQRLGPLPLPSRSSAVVAAASSAAGVALVVSGIGRFGSARQVSGGSHPRLVTDGVYAVTRNPQHVGAVAALAGLAVLRRSLVVAALAAGYAAVIRTWVPVEEANLERLFGDDYRRYRERVPRWVGFPRWGSR